MLRDIASGFGVVAPRRGAWIETNLSAEFDTGVWVAPRRGAWIETFQPLSKSRGKPRSRPAGARGLKLLQPHHRPQMVDVAPRRGAWIETRT